MDIAVSVYLMPILEGVYLKEVTLVERGVKGADAIVYRGRAVILPSANML